MAGNEFGLTSPGEASFLVAIRSKNALTGASEIPINLGQCFSQSVAKGGQQKELDHISSCVATFSDAFITLGRLLITYW